MKNLILILLLPFMISCVQIQPKGKIPDGNERQKANGSEVEEGWLIIGGQKVENHEKIPSGYEYYRKEEIESITDIPLYFAPNNKARANSLEGIEQVVNLKEIYLHGWKLDTVDYTPLKGLQHIENVLLRNGDTDRDTDRLVRPPDFSGWASRFNITEIKFDHCALTSLDNIDYLPNLRNITVAANWGDLSDIKALKGLQSLEELKIFSAAGKLRIEEISPLPKLKHLRLLGTSVDAKGIEGLRALETLGIEGNDLVNVSYLSTLRNLKRLAFTMRDAEPDIGFIGAISSLQYLTIYADDGTWGTIDKEPYQILDLGPLGKLSQLESLTVRGFMVKNVAALDHIEGLSGIGLQNSRLNDASESSRHCLIFFYDGR
jgi:Leucine-rich repeat (LRR) protein